MMEKSSKGSIQKQAKFIAPGHLARTRIYGQKTSSYLVPENASETSLQMKDQAQLCRENDIVGGISSHTLTLHFGDQNQQETDFTEDSCYLDILKMCSKFINVNKVGFEVTNGDGAPLRNDKDVLWLVEQHEFVENIDIYLEVKDGAQPVLFKLPQDNSTLGFITKVPEVKEVSILGEYKSGEKVLVKGDVLNGSKEDSTVEFYITKDKQLKIDSDLDVISTCMTCKEFQIPKEAVGNYLVAKFTPKAADGKSGKPRYAISDKVVEDSKSQKARKVRGKNKNKKVAKLKCGEKLEIEFYNNRAVGKNHKSWSRHLGKIVRNKHICPIRVLTWKEITDADKLHMWDAVKECFFNSKMELYREHTLEHMYSLWTAWRSLLNKQYVVSCVTKDEAIKNVPDGMNKEDWKWLVVNKFFTDKYREISTRNSTNRGKGVMPHRTGSQPHRQLIYEMGGKSGEQPNLSTIFKATRQKKGKFVQPEEQKKYDEIVGIIESNPSLPMIDLVERSFGPQKHSNVFTFGGGMKRKNFKDSSAAYIKDLEEQVRQRDEENKMFKKQLEDVASRLAKIEKEKQANADSLTLDNVE